MVTILRMVLAPAVIVLIFFYLVTQMSRTYNSDTEVVLGLGACFCIMALFFLLLYPVVF